MVNRRTRDNAYSMHNCNINMLLWRDYDHDIQDLDFHTMCRHVSCIRLPMRTLGKSRSKQHLGCIILVELWLTIWQYNWSGHLSGGQQIMKYRIWRGYENEYFRSDYYHHLSKSCEKWKFPYFFPRLAAFLNCIESIVRKMQMYGSAFGYHDTAEIVIIKTTTTNPAHACASWIFK